MQMCKQALISKVERLSVILHTPGRVRQTLVQQANLVQQVCSCQQHILCLSRSVLSAGHKISLTLVSGIWNSLSSLREQ